MQQRNNKHSSGGITKWTPAKHLSGFLIMFARTCPALLGSLTHTLRWVPFPQQPGYKLYFISIYKAEGRWDRDISRMAYVKYVWALSCICPITGIPFCKSCCHQQVKITCITKSLNNLPPKNVNISLWSKWYKLPIIRKWSAHYKEHKGSLMKKDWLFISV